jgi:hypothetical protein
MGSAWWIRSIGGVLLASSALSARGQCGVDGKARAMSTIMTVFASIPQDTTEKAELRRLRGTLLQEYVARFIQPMDLSSVEAAAATMVKLRGGASGGFMPMLGELRFTQMVDGRTDRVHLKLSTADARLDSALIAAALAMGIDRVSFYSSDGRDSVQMRIQLSLDPSLGFYPMKLIALRPMNLIDRSAHIIPTTIYPKWPKKLEDARVEDDVVVQVLVDRDGKPVMDSAHAVEGKHQEYIDAVIAAVAQYRWTPALSGGCPVPQWVQMPFMFHFHERRP